MKRVGYTVFIVESVDVFDPQQIYIGIAAGTDVKGRVYNLRNSILRHFFHKHSDENKTAQVRILGWFKGKPKAIELQTLKLNELKDQGINVLNSNRVFNRGNFIIVED